LRTVFVAVFVVFQITKTLWMPILDADVDADADADANVG